MYTDNADNPLEKPGCKEKKGMGGWGVGVGMLPNSTGYSKCRGT